MLLVVLPTLLHTVRNNNTFFFEHVFLMLIYIYFFIDENKTKIAKSDALRLLVDLAKSKDQRVQRNATGALLNMTHTRKYDSNNNIYIYI